MDIRATHSNSRASYLVLLIPGKSHKIFLKRISAYFIYNFSNMYPYPLLQKNITIFPIFGEQTQWDPYIFDYSNEDFLSVDPRNMDDMNNYNREHLKNSGKIWWLGWYLENRSHILKGTHIQQQGRIYHLGVDITPTEALSLFNPLHWEVYERGYEEWDGNYGWYMIIRYALWWTVFYALYGHLSYESLNTKSIIPQGESIGKLGNTSENGNWFVHLHLQIFTGEEMDTWKNRGYCWVEDVPNMKYICPDPNFLIRY